MHIKIYILTQLFGNAYVLKLDNINTFKYIYKQLDWNDPYTLERYNKVFNYDEQKIVQDGHTYNVITEDDVLDYYFDSYFYIDIVDAKTRIKVFNIYINKTKAEVIILPEKFAIDRFTEFKYEDNSSCSIDQLPENIKNYITSQLTLLTFI